MYIGQSLALTGSDLTLMRSEFGLRLPMNSECTREREKATHIIARLEILDGGAHSEFRERVMGMVEAFGGKLVGRGDISDVIEGAMP